MNTENLNTLCDKYYRVELSFRRMPHGSWQGSAAILRNDSNEQIGGTGKLGMSKEEISEHIEQALPALMQKLKRPPPEWERLDLRKIIMEYQQFNYELTSNLVQLNASLKAGTLCADELHDGFWRAREHACKGAAALALKIASLTEKDRIDLMTSPEEFYNDLDNPWHLDDLKARSDLFDFIVNPSAEVIAAHQIHEER